MLAHGIANAGPLYRCRRSPGKAGMIDRDQVSPGLGEARGVLMLLGANPLGASKFGVDRGERQALRQHRVADAHIIRLAGCTDFRDALRTHSGGKQTNQSSHRHHSTDDHFFLRLFQ